jgi:hypothetical protein
MVIVTGKYNVQRKISIKFNPAYRRKASILSQMSCGILPISRPANLWHGRNAKPMTADSFGAMNP